MGGVDLEYPSLSPLHTRTVQKTHFFFTHGSPKGERKKQRKKRKHARPETCIPRLPAHLPACLPAWLGGLLDIRAWRRDLSVRSRGGRHTWRALRILPCAGAPRPRLGSAVRLGLRAGCGVYPGSIVLPHAVTAVHSTGIYRLRLVALGPTVRVRSGALAETFAVGGSGHPLQGRREPDGYEDVVVAVARADLLGDGAAGRGRHAVPVGVHRVDGRKGRVAQASRDGRAAHAVRAAWAALLVFGARDGSGGGC